MTDYQLWSYSYTLPDTLIAQEAIHPHHDARLLVCDQENGSILKKCRFIDLPDILEKDRVLFFNNSRVLPARITLKDQKILREDGSIGTISEWEILFCQKMQNGEFEALVRPGAKFRKWTKILFDEGNIEVIDTTSSGRLLMANEVSIDFLMEKYGQLPLPPYIEYSKEKEDDYQTSFAKTNGSVAAPTASLHFTETLMQAIHNPKEYVTLHVWLGTFKWIDVDDIRHYQIHRETIEIDRDIFEKIYLHYTQNQKIIAIGTTTCRTLESLPALWNNLDSLLQSEFPIEVQNYWNEKKPRNTNNWISHINFDHQTWKIHFSTAIYITPGHVFQVIDELITNFHLPESSLLVLVSALMGLENMRKVYQHAIWEKYRFFSFGDGMYIRTKKDNAKNAFLLASERKSI
jgi:S-adenosylmethionine:tRNA ribosyltransferase-isomerase